METLKGLNNEQQEAALHVDGPLLVIAGAGSGKTRIVTFRIAHLLELGIPASEIIAVTFTNKAAEEMRERVQKIANTFVLTCTFHSLCARILREAIHVLGYKKDFVIFDEEDTEKLLKECFVRLNIKEDKGFLKKTRAEISQLKNNLQEPEPSLPIYHLYQEKLKEYNALDFDDLLFLTVKLFREHPDVLEGFQRRWSYILIDEYQDTNTAQYMIVKLLAKQHGNVFAVGDPDQSIYSWRGANIGNILNFEKDFPGAKVVSLEQNYRSRNNILQAANTLIKHNANRYEKNLWSDRGDGALIGFFIAANEREEAKFVLSRLKHHLFKDKLSLNDCVIFYRTNFQSRLYEDALLREKIPYRIVGGLSFYQRREIKDILAYLRIVLGSSDFLAFARTVNLPKRGFGESSLAKLRAFADEHHLTILNATVSAIRGEHKISPKQKEALEDYIDIIASLQEMVKNQESLSEIISHTIERTRYLEYLREDPETFEERRSNLEELITKASEWEEDEKTPTLTAFLEELSLKSSLDQKPKEENTLQLMTLHNSKGLEFSLVFLVGMEEDLLPHINSKTDPNSLEEERRLCYVGMTRAKELLYLTAARHRFLFGASRYMRPSRFLMEVPKKHLRNYQDEEEEEEELQQHTDFTPGEVVIHKEFGIGIIQKVYETSLGLTYDVLFSAGKITRSLIAKYAKLRPVD
ncbi:MAG: UvrD-helicase domain-containing protein [Chlamydiota bacterium]